MAEGSVGDVLTNLQTQRVAAGYSITRLAQLANVSDFTIITLENGGNCDDRAAQRILDALGISAVTGGELSLE